MFRSLKKAVIEGAMGTEMSDHLSYCQGESKPEGHANQRNGTGGKTVVTDDGPVRIEVPRDRQGSFEPQIIGKRERRFTGFDQKVIAMYARGMTNAIESLHMKLRKIIKSRGHFPPVTRPQPSCYGSPCTTSRQAG